MIETQITAPQGKILDSDSIRETLHKGLAGKFSGQSVLVLIPDHTRSLPLPQLFRILVETLEDAKALLDKLITANPKLRFTIVNTNGAEVSPTLYDAPRDEIPDVCAVCFAPADPLSFNDSAGGWICERCQAEYTEPTATAKQVLDRLNYLIDLGAYNSDKTQLLKNAKRAVMQVLDIDA